MARITAGQRLFLVTFAVRGNPDATDVAGVHTPHRKHQMAIKKVTHGRGFSYEMTAKINGTAVRRRLPTKKAANDEYSRLRQAALHGTYAPAARERITLDTYVREHWLPTRMVEDSTLVIYSGYYARHISPVLGGMTVSPDRTRSRPGPHRRTAPQGVSHPGPSRPSTTSWRWRCAAPSTT